MLLKIFCNKNDIIILHFIVVNWSCKTYVMKFVIFKERFFSNTYFMNEMFEKSNFHEENVQKIVIFKAKFPKNCKFHGKFSFAFFASFYLQRIFFAKFFFVCKESLFGPQCNFNSPAMILGSNSSSSSLSLAVGFFWLLWPPVTQLKTKSGNRPSAALPKAWRTAAPPEIFIKIDFF